MDKLNRWGATILLVVFFAIIAAARTNRAVQVSSNVFVTNTTANPVAVTATTTQPLPTRDAFHGKDALQRTGVCTMAASASTASLTMSAIPGERFVITNVSAASSSPSNNAAAGAVTIQIMAGPNLIAQSCLPMNATPAGTASTTVNLPVLLCHDPTETAKITFDRFPGDAVDNVNNVVTVSGYRVTYP
jgi:hypothetical protein